MSGQTDIFLEERGVSPCSLKSTGERAVFVGWDSSKKGIAKIIRPLNPDKEEKTNVFSVKADDFEFEDFWRVLVYDTETTGLPYKNEEKKTVWPRLVELAYNIIEFPVSSVANSAIVESFDSIIEPSDFEIPLESQAVHGISTEEAIVSGLPIEFVLSRFQNDHNSCDIIAAHNINFDKQVMRNEFKRIEHLKLTDNIQLCTMNKTRSFCKLNKAPKLIELYQKLFKKDFDNQHRAKGDVLALSKCLKELIEKKVIDLGEIACKV